MTTLALTQEQEDSLTAKVKADFDKQVKQLASQKVKEVAAIKRQADARVFRARQKTSNWKLQYAETRKNLLAARAEIIMLKRRLRNGEWDDA
jgi:leucyl aminopeptidase (aminopeptidase T)